jgi:hypothetical protein
VDLKKSTTSLSTLPTHNRLVAGPNPAGPTYETAYISNRICSLILSLARVDANIEYKNNDSNLFGALKNLPEMADFLFGCCKSTLGFKLQAQQRQAQKIPQKGPKSKVFWWRLLSQLVSNLISSSVIMLKFDYFGRFFWKSSAHFLTCSQVSTAPKRVSSSFRVIASTFKTPSNFRTSSRPWRTGSAGKKSRVPISNPRVIDLAYSCFSPKLKSG